MLRGPWVLAGGGVQAASGDAKTGTVAVDHDGERVATVEVNETTRDEVRTIVSPADEGANEYEIAGPEDIPPGDLEQVAVPASGIPHEKRTGAPPSGGTARGVPGKVPADDCGR